MINIDKNISFCTDAQDRSDPKINDSSIGYGDDLKTIIIDEDYVVCIGDDYADASLTIRRF